MRRNPLLYSDHHETEDTPQSFVTENREPPPRESSFFFYLIILANSLLVLFVLGFIWFLFLKSPDLQIKELSNRFFGTNHPTTELEQPTFVVPDIKTEIVITPSQQEKDETQQAKLKQMREKEELAAERTRIEEMKAEIELEKMRAKEAQQAITSLQEKEESANANMQGKATPPVEVITPAEPIVAEPKDMPISVEQTIVENAAAEPAEKTNSTQSQVDLIMETLKQQQTETSN